MQRCLAMHDSAVEFVDHFGARHRWSRHRFEPRCAVLIDHDAVRRSAQIGALAAYQ